MQLLEKTWEYSKYQFALWRLVFGFYLTFYAVWLWPYATKIYSNEGMFPEPYLQMYFPSPLYFSADPMMVHALMVLHVLGALSIWIGVYRHVGAILYLFSAASFLQWNGFTEDPALSFVHLAVALTLLLPATEPLQLRPSKSKEAWQMPYFVYLTALIALGVGYSISGIDKLRAVGWQIGDAMYYLYHLAIAYDVWWMDVLRSQPMWLIKIQTYVAVGAMLTALPLLLWRRTRIFSWAVLTGMFLFTLVAFNLWQVSIGMLLFHAFLIEPSWLRAKAGKLTLYYDGECPFCRGFVRFLAYEDRQGYIEAKPLQREDDGTCGDSIVVLSGSESYEKSAAVRVLFAHIGGVWRVLSWGGCLIPAKVSDWMYDFVGKRRYLISKYVQ